MKTNLVVSPSTLVDSILPLYVTETYKNFVKFITTADQSEERIGFSQNILQNLQKYRNLDTFEKKIIQYGVLAANLSATADEFVLESGDGFPDENGVVNIENELILYREREGNIFRGLQRGASGTIILPDFTNLGEYVDSTPADHLLGAPVQNVSVLFLVSFLKTIYQSYASDINSDRVSPQINDATLIENIRDFFTAKGSKLGIKALFKILFAETDVDVNYPGDRMIIPSNSTWSESLIMRTVPIPPNLVNPSAKYVLPTKIQNSQVNLKSFNDTDVLATSVCDYVSAYPYEGNIQYEMYLNKDEILGDFVANPVTKLTRELFGTGEGPNALVDTDTITVESTLGFPNSGILFIGNEGIEYTSKTLNQFFGCKRGHIGIETSHVLGSDVYGPYYIEAKTNIEGDERTSFSWPLGLVQDVDVVEGGLLHTKEDDVYINGPGRINPRVPVLASLLENYNEQLVSQNQLPPDLTFVSNYTTSINGVYFDSNYVFIGSSGFPYYPIGPFSDNGTVGSNLSPEDTIYVIPRELRENNDISTKGTDQVGISVDGVPIYSEVSPVDLVQGEIKTFKIVNRGRGYQNPTVMLDPPLSSASANVVNGQIVSILQTTTANYTETPKVTITSGEGASFQIFFDNYGRIENVLIDNAGQFYNDIPSLSVVDSSGRGNGALISCTVENGGISTVTVQLSGIDYNPLTTTIVTTPIGSDAVVEAEVEKYQFNRYQSIVNNPNWSFDSGNGFLWNGPAGINSTFGYICNPLQLRSQLNDDGTKHSPILGWAFDGNPIYGPYGYTNTKNDSGGVERQRSGYTLRSSRVGLGSSPPSDVAYPMGTFVEDYEFTPPVVGTFYITTESGLDLESDAGNTDPNAVGDFITADTQAIAGNVLNENNGRICNTPEYPEEIFPDGVFAYFVTIDELGTPQFPYMIGTTFENRPISQQLSVSSDTTDTDFLRDTAYSPSSYDNTELTFNFTRVERYRNPFLSETKEDVDIKIADVSTGSISSVIVESGLPNTTKVGDVVYYDNSGTDGSGAEGKVSFVTGEPVERARGQLVSTFLRSHHQRIDLEGYKGLESFVFVKDTYILCSSGAIAQVKEWNTTNYHLTVQTLTYDRIKYDDVFYDNTGKRVKCPPRPDEAYYGLFGLTEVLGASRPNEMLISPGAPSLAIGGADPEPGDIWWSIFNGRLYVYYDDGNTEQWVEAQPMGTQPIEGTASNTGVGTTAATPQDVINAGSGTTVTISTLAPDQRQDGTPNQLGDLWWSNQTGLLYIWYTDLLVSYSATETVSDTQTAQWVMTDPTGTVPMEGAVDQYYPELPNAAVDRGNIYTSSLTCLISPTSPNEQADGTPIEMGNLWWCSANGKMYIYWNDGDTAQWTQTTPVGSIVTAYGSDDPLKPIPGPEPIPDPGGGDDIGLLPETRDQRLLWFRDMTNFLAGDIVNFQLGAPGSEPLTEISKIESVGTPDNANGIFIRGFNDDPLALPNNTVMVNDSRAIYQIDTTVPTNLNKGDIVLIEGSDFPEVNATHTVAQAGYVIPAQVMVNVNFTTGEVESVTILDSGAYYSKDFYVFFTGGGGQGAIAYAYVAPLVKGGGVELVEMVSNGINYTSTPTPLLGTELTNTQFQIYVNNLYGTDTGNVKYSAHGDNVINTAAYVEVNSGGIGYARIPAALGLYKNEADRANLIINDGIALPDGSGIERVTVVRGGARYVNPTAIFGDRTNSGSGAAAEVTVENGVVTAVTVTNSGSGYVEPYVTLVEEDGKYISLTNDIGKIRAGLVINPGRDISVDRSLKPELQITTRCIIRYINQLRGPFVAGTEVYQGTEDRKLVTATVVDYDDKIQQLTLEKVNGVLQNNQVIQDDYGTTATVILEGEADCRALVNGTSKPQGEFINQTSQLGTKYAVIQDSKKYQWFSYEISSGISRTTYENFVNDIVHPAGFIMFSRMDINDSIATGLEVSEPELLPSLNPQIDFIGEGVGADGYGLDVVIGAQGYGPDTPLGMD